MSATISNVTQSQVAQNAPPAPAAHAKTSPPTTQPAPSDTVTIGNAAKIALQETQETHTQTVKEANGGDSQAIRLLARQAPGTISKKA